MISRWVICEAPGTPAGGGAGSLATSALVIVPHIQLKSVEAPALLKPYTAAQLRGRQVYIENGCIYCHSQQPRDRAQAPDDKRGWGRASVAADYYYDKPHLLGTIFHSGILLASAMAVGLNLFFNGRGSEEDVSRYAVAAAQSSDH